MAGHFQLGGVRCSTHSIAELLAELRMLLADKAATPRTILYVNAHVHNLAARDAGLRRALADARITAADGMGVVWAARLFGIQMAERCNMTEAFTAFLTDDSMPPSRALLFGCTESEARAAAAKATADSAHCRVVGAHSGFLDDTAYRDILSAQKEIDLILLGMGTPRTELLAGLTAAVCPGAIIWAIGGGTIRIYAGRMREAPVLWRRTGLQWLYRLGAEPRQLWHRYLLGNPVFVMRILACRLWGRTEKN
jgi:N-acetylglucosaminyldiphosphoundecaprenol N-acetyl-beta-D-mannosaminyltransferase